jgi:iron-sulfur cluster insertion protein
MQNNQNNNTSDTVESEQIINLSPEATEKIYSIIEEEGSANPLFLRVFVNGGGCSGFQYGFTLDEQSTDEDFVIEKNVPQTDKQIKVLVDYMSLNYLKGAEITYQDDLNGAQFVIKNPNATSTCGCGSSFSV